jgi:IclR family pca regulon transcriptional regulator
MTLSSLTPRTLTTAQAVLEQVAICRRDGHSVCDGELELEVRSMAVPVANHSGIVIGALSIAVRADRMDVDELRRTFLPALRRAQARLKDQLFED